MDRGDFISRAGLGAVAAAIFRSRPVSARGPQGRRGGRGALLQDPLCQVNANVVDVRIGRVMPRVVLVLRGGRSDLVVGETYGDVIYFEHTGSREMPVFAGAIKLGNLQNRAKPLAYDFDRDGRLSVVGAAWGARSSGTRIEPSGRSRCSARVAHKAAARHPLQSASADRRVECRRR